MAINKLAWDDAILAQGWQRGDGQAAAAVAARYTAALGAAAYGILGEYGLAEEAVQEAFYRAARQIGRLREHSRLGPWLMGIVRHVALDMYRKRGRERPLTGLDPPSKAAGPDVAAQRAELRNHLEAAFFTLPEDQREIFLMKYVANMSYRAIARVTDLTPAAVSQKLWRVRQKLQKELDASLFERG